MTVTRVELRADGSRWIFHRRGRQAWTHPSTDHYLRDNAAPGGQPKVRECPVCQNSLTTGRRRGSGGTGS